jgi:site-specific DNA-methyltransferase (adenine-specific)
MKKLVHADSIEILKALETNSVDLIIADPPYWKVINEDWDYEWKTEEQYIDWCISWISEVSRVLRYGGTFYLFGYFRTLAHLIPSFEKLSLELRQQIVIDKGIRSIGGRATKNYKIFPNTTESILFIIKDNKKFLKPFLKNLQVENSLSSKEINEKLGVKSNGGGMWSIYTGNNVCEQFPTKKLWSKLQEILKFDLPYEKVAQEFNAQMGLTDVWRDIDFYEEERIHPTQKPIKLIKRLIIASSREGDFVFDPFGGSGSTAIASEMLNRNYLVVERKEEYHNLAIERLSKYNC